MISSLERRPPFYFLVVGALALVSPAGARQSEEPIGRIGPAGAREAAEAYQAALKADPKHKHAGSPHAGRRLVMCQLRLRLFDQAIAAAEAYVKRVAGTPHEARAERRVGNLYLNRGSTGALVARQPFGGFGMSGVGSKAGGRDYLLQFVEPRASCENTMRRGFAPEL